MGHTSALDNFLALHKEQLISSAIPEHFWNTINEKILNQTFNAGETFQLVKIDYGSSKLPHEPTWGLQVTRDIKKLDPSQIYLIDHAWTFRVGHAKNQLLQFDDLRSRMCNILGLTESDSNEQVAQDVFNNVWRICNTYSIGNAETAEDRVHVWYVMDEIGSAVSHSDTPNCRIVPFIYINDQIVYSLLFPVEDIEEGDLIFRDFAEAVVDANQRTAALLPWVPDKFTSFSFKPEMPGPDYYLSGHIEESLPILSYSTQPVVRKEKYKVYTEYIWVRKCLSDKNFEITNDEDEADILWYTRHFKDFEKLSLQPERFVNQFPFEYVLTIKDLLCLTCRRHCKQNEPISSPKWLPITYNLKTEIANFIAYFQDREENGLENHWIIKPFNLARGLDTHITDNINYIMRLPATGPKIAQKYISNPVLFYRPECEGSVKFDIRYVILLRSVKPLKVYAYKQFFLRFANKPFELNDFHIFEKHFTVMNYEENVTLKHMLCSEFKTRWAQQYASYPWDNIEESIVEMFHDIFQAAVGVEPPCGIAESPQSRALYAADLMLEWSEDKTIQPKILEINWTPDCKRACEYYPSFYDEIFKLLFLDEKSNAFIEL